MTLREKIAEIIRHRNSFSNCEIETDFILDLIEKELPEKKEKVNPSHAVGYYEMRGFNEAIDLLKTKLREGVG